MSVKLYFAVKAVNGGVVVEPATAFEDVSHQKALLFDEAVGESFWCIEKARRLHGRLGLAVEMADERLSSFEAKQQLAEQGHRGNYKQAPADSQAAALILDPWLAERDKHSA